MATGLSEDEIDNSFIAAKNILEFNKNRKHMILKGVREVIDET